MRTILASAAFALVLGFSAFLGTPGAPLHPCHPGGPGGPGGPPCPPTATPFPSSGGSGSSPSSETALVGFLVRNRTAENVTLWIGAPVRYILNVPGETEMVFTVDRNVYPYDLSACSRVTSGYLNLTIHTFIDIGECDGRVLVAVDLQNDTGLDLAVQLHGPGDYVIPLLPGETRPVTIARGEYEAVLAGCPGSPTVVFSARAGRTIAFGCP